MKQHQLQELIRHITRSVIKEFTTLSSTDKVDTLSSDPTAQDPNAPPTDAMTSAEKLRQKRDLDHQRQRQIKQKQIELDAKKKEMDFNKKKLDQQKRFDIPNANKELQRLKGAQI